MSRQGWGCGGGPVTGDRADSGGPAAADGVRRWHADLAWLPGGVRPGVLIEASGERFVSVRPDVRPGDVPAGTVRLPGLTLPGLANAHSHAFHRALRGAAQAGQGTFWTWRERMYQVAARLEPDSYLALARAVYAEMAMAGIACVGEFHYLHHATGGVALRGPEPDGAGADRGGGAGGGADHPDRHLLPVRRARQRRFPEPLAGPQLRFGDGDSDRWAQRVRALGADQHGMLAGTPGWGWRSIRCARCRRARCTRSSPARTPTARRCTPICPSRSPRTRPAWPRTGSRPRSCSTGSGRSGPAPRWCTRRISPGATSSCWAGAAPCVCMCPTTEADLADGMARPVRSPSRARR